MKTLEKTLESTKQALRSKYLGRNGIHAFGIRRDANAVCVYIDHSEQDSERINSLVHKMQREARPFSVVAVESERAEFV
jgi:hypothetical protein